MTVAACPTDGGSRAEAIEGEGHFLNQEIRKVDCYNEREGGSCIYCDCLLKLNTNCIQ